MTDVSRFGGGMTVKMGNTCVFVFDAIQLVSDTQGRYWKYIGTGKRPLHCRKLQHP